MTSKYFIGLLIIFSVLIVGCSNTAEKPASDLEGVNEQIVERNESSNNVDDETPTDTDFSGRLIYTNNQNLYIRHEQTFDEPVLVAESVDTQHLFFSPDNHSIIYGVMPTSVNLGPVLHRTDLRTNEQYRLAEFSWSFRGTQWAANSWSPNEEWVTFMGSGYVGIGVAKLDGSVLRQVTQERNNIVVWLTDNRLLIINRTVIDNETQVTHIEVLDPQINKREVFSVAKDISQDINEIKALITRAGFEPLDPEYLTEENFVNFNPIIIGVQSEDTLEYSSRPHPENTNRYCGTWDIYQQPTILAANEVPETTLLHQVEDVGAVTDVQVLGDGSLIFIQWTFPKCEFLQTPQGELVHWQTDGTVVVLADDLARTSDRNQILDAANYRFRRYAIAPDSQAVAWISTSENGRDTELHIMDLVTLERVTVDSVTNQDEGFATVYWLQS